MYGCQFSLVDGLFSCNFCIVCEFFFCSVFACIVRVLQHWRSFDTYLKFFLTFIKLFSRFFFLFFSVFVRNSCVFLFNKFRKTNAFMQWHGDRKNWLIFAWLNWRSMFHKPTHMSDFIIIFFFVCYFFRHIFTPNTYKQVQQHSLKLTTTTTTSTTVAVCLKAPINL